MSIISKFNLVCDIETGPLHIEHLREIMPSFEASKALKDPEKIKADIEGKMNAWLGDAALNADTGQVLAIGFKTGEGVTTFVQGEATTEGDVLKAAWKFIGDAQFPRIIGHNIKAFDLPFMMRRSWAVGVVPVNFMKGRYFDASVVDTLEAYACGTREMIGLGRLAKFLGVGEPFGSGKDFSKLFFGSEEDQKNAMKHLVTDLELTWKVAERMNLL